MSDITLNTQSITGNHNFVPPGTDWNLGSGSKKWNGGYFGTIIADNGIPAGTAATGGDKIGQIRFSINPNIEPGYLALNGQEVNRDDYPNLWEWVQQQVGFLVEEGEWQSISDAHNGNVGKYSVGDGTSTFRLPNLGCWVRGGGTAGTANGVGGNLDAGLPNLAGNTYTSSWTNPGRDTLFYKPSGSNRSLGYNDESANEIWFDASHGNPIYGNAETVQPEFIIGIWLVKAYHVPVTDMGQDITVNGTSADSATGDITLGYSIYSPTDFNAYPHNGIYRGKNLGTFTSTAELETFLSNHEIATGNFTDLYLGDYFTIQDGTYNANWMIAGFDTEFYKGWLVDGSSDVQWINQHHITLIPRIPLFNAQMNSTNTTSGGYKGSAMHTSTLPTVVSNLQTVLGTHLLKRYALLSNAVDTTRSNMFGTAGGASSSWEWTEVYATLPSEVQIYGSTIWSSSGYDTGEACMKLPVFNFINHVQFSRWDFWLRGVASSSGFCIAGSYGDAFAWDASGSIGVRPVICIG
jgi:hypothetical protein